MIPPQPGRAFEWENIREPLKLSAFFTLAYSVLHLVADRFVIPRRVGHKLLDSLDRERRIYLSEKYEFPLPNILFKSFPRICSTLNALIVGGAGVYYSVIQPHFRGTEGIIDRYPHSFHWFFSSYVGYSVYDMLAMLAVGGEHWTMWMHHLIGAAGAFLMMLYRQAAYFPIVFTITELSVIPTNWLWALRTLQVSPQSSQYRVAHMTRSIAFLGFRTFLAPVCLWYAWQQVGGPNLPATEKLQVWRQIVGRLPWVISAGTIFNVGFLGGLNLWWTMTVGRGVLKRILQRRAPSTPNDKDQ